MYPVYVDSNAMAGRAGEYADGKWDRLVYLPCNAENGFVPALPDKPVDVFILCYPNNPTGTVLNREQLTKWVNYARENGRADYLRCGVSRVRVHAGYSAVYLRD